MKRKEIIDIVESAGQLMDFFEHVEIKNHETGELIGVVPEGDIKGMQTALCFCRHLLDGSYSVNSAAELASDMIRFHSEALFDLSGDGYEGTEWRAADSEEGTDD